MSWAVLPQRSAIRRMFHQFVLLLSLIGLMPGVDLLIEQAAELIGHGHLAHSTGEPDPLAAEHGCTPTDHHCACAHAAGASLAPRLNPTAHPPRVAPWGLVLTLSRRQSKRARTLAAADRSPAHRATAPPTPPPDV